MFFKASGFFKTPLFPGYYNKFYFCGSHKCTLDISFCIIKKTPQMGIEPTTHRLEVGRSFH